MKVTLRWYYRHGILGVDEHSTLFSEAAEAAYIDLEHDASALDCIEEIMDGRSTVYDRDSAEVRGVWDALGARRDEEYRTAAPSVAVVEMAAPSGRWAALAAFSDRDEAAAYAERWSAEFGDERIRLRSLERS